MSYLVVLTFLPAISFLGPDGEIDDPIITIYRDSPVEGQPIAYAFPILTERIYEIYRNVMMSIGDIQWTLEYTPDQVTIQIPITDLSLVDIIQDQSNFDITEGDNWGNLILDQESRAFIDTGELEEDENILYIPLLSNLAVFKAGREGNWETF